VAAFVTSRLQGSDGAGGWPCRGEVILDLPAAVVLRYTREGIVEELGPDRCRLVLGSWSWPGLAATIGRFDADIEVIGPTELKAAFAHLGRRYTNAGSALVRVGSSVRHDAKPRHHPKADAGATTSSPPTARIPSM
jgi:hypothetical protein